MNYSVFWIDGKANDEIFCESFTEAMKILISLFDEWTSKYGDDAILARDALIYKYDPEQIAYIVDYFPPKERYIKQIPNRRKAGYIA
jgi:hypothetical protein